jgi:diacylglycerol kinase family enzyme
MIREGRPAAVLIVNPNAGRVSERTREDVVAAVRSRFQIEAYATTARDTGITLAAKAVEAGASLVIAYGGDGHVNEVANGVAGTDASLGILPGGTMDVFARALNIPLDPFKAIDRILALLPQQRQTVSLGRMDDRYFTFSAGCGFDAEAAERVERYVPAKRRFGQLFFYWSAFRVLASTYRHRAPVMNIKGDFGEVDVAMAIASNTGPYAYIGNRAVRIAPDVKLDAGIDIFALKTMRIEALPAYAWRCLVTGDLVRHPDAFYESNLDWFEVRADRPFHRHVDGEPLPAARSARFSIVPNILKVVA